MLSQVVSIQPSEPWMWEIRNSSRGAVEGIGEAAHVPVGREHLADEAAASVLNRPSLPRFHQATIVAKMTATIAAIPALS
jgi:hypothetical protein